MTFDGGGAAGHSVFLRRDDGRLYDPCEGIR
jgi:hypothetical protein